jgi:hypothetical protein
MDSDSEWNAIFAWLKHRMHHDADEFLKAGIPSPQKPERHKNAAFAKNGPKFNKRRNDPTPDFKSLEKAVENSPGVPKK